MSRSTVTVADALQAFVTTGSQISSLWLLAVSSIVAVVSGPESAAIVIDISKSAQVEPATPIDDGVDTDSMLAVTPEQKCR
ncbi:MAG: hypothetical protein WBE26_02540 [Phycisphaerae bacterium]